LYVFRQIKMPFEIEKYCVTPCFLAITIDLQLVYIYFDKILRFRLDLFNLSLLSFSNLLNSFVFNY
jgi:hypothetical protein